MSVETYDPKKVDVIWGGIPLGGFPDGTFIEVERDEPIFNKTTGADGKTSRAKTNNKSGQVRITLKQTSPSNDVLSASAQADELANSGVVPLLIQDKSGRSKYASGFAWVNQWPTPTYSKEIEGYQWTIETANLNIFVGGNDS